MAIAKRKYSNPSMPQLDLLKALQEQISWHYNQLAADAERERNELSISLQKLAGK